MTQPDRTGKVRRAYKMRAYPTARQERAARDLLAAHCELYNAALQERRDAWRMCRHSVTYGDQSAQLRAVRECRPDQAVWSFTAQQQTLRRLRRAFDAFHRRCRRGETPGYPRFRSHTRFDTVDHVNGDGAKWTATQGRWARCAFQGVGTLKVDEHTAVVGRVTQVSLKREGCRWYVVVTSAAEPEPLPSTGRDLGIDVGVARFLTTCDGEVVANPRFLGIAAAELAALQQAVARSRPGSGNRRRAKRKVAKLHRQVANRRRDFHHKTARALVDTCDAIAVEALDVANMTRSATGTIAEPGSNVAQKRGLNRAILDAGWGQFVAILTAKAAWAGRRVIAVNPAGTSRTCADCGSPVVRPRQDTVICAACGPLDADLNAARNIATRAGLGSGQPIVG